VRLLLAAKADVNAQDNDGKTALTMALQNGHAEVAKILTSAGAVVPTQK
jgi:ankyrin repeat protein